MTDALVTTPTAAAIAEQVVIKGDLSKLTETERMAYYSEVCRSLGLNPLTRPFEYITLNNRLTLYATRAAGDQLRSIRGITITGLDPRQVGDLFVVVATGRDRTGREDSATGAVAVKGLTGEALANAMMKAETKAKRRLTLSLAGLGWSDETEVADIPVEPTTPRAPLAERLRAETLSLEPMTPEASARFVNAEEVAEGAVAVELMTPAHLAELCRAQGKTKGMVATAIGTVTGTVPSPDKVSDVVKALSEEQLTRLADELNLDWRTA